VLKQSRRVATATAQEEAVFLGELEKPRQGWRGWQNSFLLNDLKQIQ
jgi:hypothetical protein